MFPINKLNTSSFVMLFIYIIEMENQIFSCRFQAEGASVLPLGQLSRKATSPALRTSTWMSVALRAPF